MTGPEVQVAFGKLPWPFRAKRGDAPRVVHASHHLCGTLWFHKIFTRLQDRFGLTYHTGHQTDLGDEALFLQDHAELDREALGPFRGTHMIRDPRDIVVIGYHYHRRGDAAWTQKPNPHLGTSYAAHLQSLSLEDGLFAEINRFSWADAPALAAWDYDDARFLELRLEDVLAHPKAWFEAVFSHYGLADWAIEAAVDNAVRKSRPPKIGTDPSHFAHPGSWVMALTDAHIADLDEKTQGLPRALGYPDP